MPRILIASDKFKGSLTAAQVAAALEAGIRRARTDVAVRSIAVADGGDGTVAAALAAGFEGVMMTAGGPTGVPVTTTYARKDEVAVIEMADVSGLARLPDGVLRPLSATTHGTGEVIAAAVDNGCKRIVLGVGGSASTDGGTGLVQALGAQLFDRDGNVITPINDQLRNVDRIDLRPLLARMLGVEVVVACDVDNPLTGPSGAAAVYGPQKGASPTQVAQLDSLLSHWADVVAAATGTDFRDYPGAGAAGGVGFAALGLLGATLRPGIDLVLELVGFESELEALTAGTDLIVTGEGSLDAQTLHGKAPTGVATAARTAGVKVVAVCGQNLLDDDQLISAGIASTYALTDIEPNLARCFTNAEQLLTELGELIVREHLT